MTNISLPNSTTTINSPIHQAIQQTIHPHTKIQWAWPLGQHCQLRLGGNPRLTRIITYTIIQQPLPYTNIQWAWGNTVSWGWVETLGLLGSSPTQSYNNHYHTPTSSGLGQHSQLRLGGNPRLTRIRYLHNHTTTITIHHTNTSTSSELGATYVCMYVYIYSPDMDIQKYTVTMKIIVNSVKISSPIGTMYQ